MSDRITRQTIADQVSAQGLVLGAGETPVRYRDLVAMNNALVSLGGRALPTKEARIHVARCRRALKPHIDDYTDERQRIQRTHLLESEDVTASDGDRFQFRDPAGMAREFAELDAMVAPVIMPRQITDAMLPVNSKASPNNEDGMPNILADLGPLYLIDADEEEEE